MLDTVVVSADWLAERLDEVRIVDVRDGWEYEGIGHLPGAVNIPFDEFRSADADDAGMLPGAETWADLLGNAGISENDTIVAYDDMHGVFAARFLVTAELYGHGNLHLLDGDFSSWQGTHETTTNAPEPEAVTYQVREPEETPLVSREEVESAIDDPDAVLVDTRDPEEFADGHLPNAVNVDWLDLVDDETRGLKSPDELRDILESNGVTPDKRVVLYCNTARRISHTYVVLSHLGYDDIGFYEGSLTEWTDSDGELETA
ncbi:thiosulfate/3-mercaptopyruvate sulfurtransferase [Haladaptatus litoreus]|uniref:Thiosulfate/3-mercaptopyruvate sulfurtransferase n=1 Tax=Haladaptatus litoreus TaxID=553468 RepID=A0A1N7BQR5_9EURY|nr:sulfurtransferase [Haladaptatus litoreus]SIR53534.1 thiosulfate/3-mercaptopyruvate sulfurtransferase [Haladaptatus litoreus]